VRLAAPALGLDATLYARRAATDDQIDLQIRSPEGFASTRLLQIHWHWRKISAAPPGSEPPAGVGALTSLLPNKEYIIIRVLALFAQQNHSRSRLRSLLFPMSVCDVDRMR
jgi:hypothetical protein